MAEQGSVTTSFVAGKTPQGMRGRYDHPLYVSGAEELLNVIATPGGSLIRRPGCETIIDTGTIAYSSRMIPFHDPNNNGALIFFEPDNNVKVYQNDVQVLNVAHNIPNGLVPIDEMDYVQVRDYIFFTHKTFAPKMIVKERIETLEGNGTLTEFDYPYVVVDTTDIEVRVDDVLKTLTTDYTITTFDKVDGQFEGIRITFVTAPTNGAVVEIKRKWSFHNYPNLDGPWERENTDNTLKVAVHSAASGSADEGYYGTAILKGVTRKGGALKAWLNDSWVGRQMRVWSSESSEEQYATITFDSINISKTNYNVTISETHRIADLSTTSATYAPRTKRWALAAWYEGQYPEVVGVHQDSLWFGRGNDRWKTISGSLFTFSPSLPDDQGVYQITADSGISITGSDPVSTNPSWLFGDKVLFSATNAAQMIIQGGSTFGAIAPSTVSILKQSTIGAAKIKPVARNDLYFVDNYRQNIYKFEYKFQRSSFVADKINQYDDLLFEKYIRKMCLIKQPFHMLWCLMEDFSLVCLTINETDNVFAPTVFTGLQAIDITVIEQSDGTEDIYILTNEGKLAKFGDFITAEGERNLRVNIGSEPLLILPSGSYYLRNNTLDSKREFLTDFATSYNGGTSIDLNTILSTQVVVDDSNYENWKYSSTSKTVTPTNKYEVGTPFSVGITTNQINTVQGSLTDINRSKKLKKAYFNLDKTLNFKVKEVDNSDYEEVKIREGLSDLSEPPATYTGLKKFNLHGNKKTSVQLQFTQDESVPFTLNSIVYEYEI